MYSVNTCNSTCSNTTRDICFLSAYLHFLPCANLSWSSWLVKQNLSLTYSRVIKCLVSYVTTAPQCHIWSWDRECLQDNIINNSPALKSFYTVWFLQPSEATDRGETSWWTFWTKYNATSCNSCGTKHARVVQSRLLSKTIFQHEQTWNTEGRKRSLPFVELNLLISTKKSSGSQLY